MSREGTKGRGGRGLERRRGKAGKGWNSGGSERRRREGE